MNVNSTSLKNVSQSMGHIAQELAEVHHRCRSYEHDVTSLLTGAIAQDFHRQRQATAAALAELSAANRTAVESSSRRLSNIAEAYEATERGNVAALFSAGLGLAS